MLVTESVKAFWATCPREDRKEVLQLAKQLPVPLAVVVAVVAAARTIKDGSVNFEELGEVRKDA